MKFSKLTVAITGILSAGAAMDANAEHSLNLYMDSKTKQIYAEPCARCVPLGSFERVESEAKQNKALPKGKRFFRPARLSVVFGKQISIEKTMPYQEIARLIMGSIAQLSNTNSTCPS